MEAKCYPTSTADPVPESFLRLPYWWQISKTLVPGLYSALVCLPSITLPVAICPCTLRVTGLTLSFQWFKTLALHNSWCRQSARFRVFLPAASNPLLCSCTLHRNSLCFPTLPHCLSWAPLEVVRKRTHEVSCVWSSVGFWFSSVLELSWVGIEGVLHSTVLPCQLSYNKY